MEIRGFRSLASLSLLALLPAAVVAQASSRFVPDQMENVLYGVAYYPEYMPTDRLDSEDQLL